LVAGAITVSYESNLESALVEESPIGVLDRPSDPGISSTESEREIASTEPVTQPVASAAGASTRQPIPERLRDRFPRGVNWWVTGWMAVMHVGALAALFQFTWSGLAIFAVTHFVSACLGITLGYHRLLTHGSFVAPGWFRYFVSMCGMLCAEGSPLYWVATHRKHHACSDEEDDPHSPRHGFWWAHMLWITPYETAQERDALFRRWAPDLYRDPVHRFFHITFPVYSMILAAVLYGVGESLYSAGLSWLLWGVCARMVVAYHCTWFVNSATHVWGYRNYQTTDMSRNLWWVALLSYGEGWHNNHHAHQRLAPHGHRWWEFDVTWNVIRLLRAVGIATKVQDRLPEHSH
jgi:stearoyl-CoA desaturase (delta-9 desaturase)